MTVIGLTDNKNPIVGSRNGSTQEISLFDTEIGNRRIISTTPEKVDSFLKERKATLEKNNKKTALGVLGGFIASAGIVAVTNIDKNVKLKQRRLGILLGGACLFGTIFGNCLLSKRLENIVNSKIDQKFIQENK